MEPALLGRFNSCGQVSAEHKLRTDLIQVKTTLQNYLKLSTNNKESICFKQKRPNGGLKKARITNEKEYSSLVYCIQNQQIVIFGNKKFAH